MIGNEPEVGDTVRLHGGGSAVVHDVHFKFLTRRDGSEIAHPRSVLLRCAGCGRDFPVRVQHVTGERKRPDCRGCARQARRS